MDRYAKYLRHKLKSIYLPHDEFNRLRGLSSSAPGPTPWNAGSLPPLRGPNNSELRWRKSDHMGVVLGNEERREDLFAFGWLLLHSSDRNRSTMLLVSYQHGDDETNHRGFETARVQTRIRNSISWSTFD